MNASLAHTIESLFGPASEVIDVSEFLQCATNVVEIARDADPPTIPSEIAEHCRWPPFSTTVTDLLMSRLVSRKSVIC